MICYSNSELSVFFLAYVPQNEDAGSKSSIYLFAINGMRMRMRLEKLPRNEYANLQDKLHLSGYCPYYFLANNSRRFVLSSENKFRSFPLFLRGVSIGLKYISASEFSLIRVVLFLVFSDGQIIKFQNSTVITAQFKFFVWESFFRV